MIIIVLPPHKCDGKDHRCRPTGQQNPVASWIECHSMALLYSIEAVRFKGTGRAGAGGFGLTAFTKRGFVRRLVGWSVDSVPHPWKGRGTRASWAR